MWWHARILFRVSTYLTCMTGTGNVIDVNKAVAKRQPNAPYFIGVDVSNVW